MKATDIQEGGTHYRAYPIQPIQYIVANGIGFLAGNVIKYVTRYGRKNGAEDIRKAIHYLQLILEFEYPTAVNSANTPKCPWCNGAGGHHMPLCRAVEDAEIERRKGYDQIDCQDPQRNTGQGIRPAGTQISDRGQKSRQERPFPSQPERDFSGESQSAGKGSQ